MAGLRGVLPDLPVVRGTLAGDVGIADRTGRELEIAESQGQNPIIRGLRAATIGGDAGSLAYDALSAEVRGDKEQAQSLRNQALELQQHAAAVGPEITRLEQVHGVGDALSLIGGHVGQGLATTVPAIAGAVVGRGLLGGLGRAGTMGGALLSRLGPTGAAIARSGGLPGAAAATIGAYPASYYPEAGEAALTQYNDPESMKIAPEERQRVMRLKGGVGALMESVVPALVASRVMGGAGHSAIEAAKRLTLKQAAKEGLANMGEEFLTETGQEKVGQIAHSATNPNRDTSGDIMDLINAGVAGAAGGGGISAVGSGVQAGMAGAAAGVRKGVDVARDLATQFGESVAQPVRDRMETMGIGGTRTPVRLDDGRDELRTAAMADLTRSPEMSILTGKNEMPPDVAANPDPNAHFEWQKGMEAQRRDAAVKVATALTNDPQATPERRAQAQAHLDNIDDPSSWDAIAQLAGEPSRARQLQNKVRDAVEHAKQWAGETIEAAAPKAAKLTADAAEFLKAAASGIPAFVSRKLRDIARRNGMTDEEISKSTPQDIKAHFERRQLEDASVIEGDYDVIDPVTGETRRSDKGMGTRRSELGTGATPPSAPRSALDLAVYDVMAKHLPAGVNAQELQLNGVFDAAKSFIVQNLGAPVSGERSGKATAPQGVTGSRRVPGPILDLWGEQALPMINAVHKTLTQGGVFKTQDELAAAGGTTGQNEREKRLAQLQKYQGAVNDQSRYETAMVAANMHPRVRALFDAQGVAEITRGLANLVRHGRGSTQAKKIEALMDGVPVVNDLGEMDHIPLFAEEKKDAEGHAIGFTNRKEQVLAELARSTKDVDEAHGFQHNQPRMDEEVDPTDSDTESKDYASDSIEGSTQERERQGIEESGEPKPTYVFQGAEGETLWNLNHPDPERRASINQGYQAALERHRGATKGTPVVGEEAPRSRVSGISVRQWADETGTPYIMAARKIDEEKALKDSHDEEALAEMLEDPNYRVIKVEPASDSADTVDLSEADINKLINETREFNTIEQNITREEYEAGIAGKQYPNVKYRQKPGGYEKVTTTDTTDFGRVFLHRANYDQEARNAAIDKETGEVPDSVPGKPISISAHSLIKMMREKKKEGAFQGKTAEGAGAQDMAAMFAAGMSSLLNSPFIYSKPGRPSFTVKNKFGKVLQGEEQIREQFKRGNMAPEQWISSPMVTQREEALKKHENEQALSRFFGLLNIGGGKMQRLLHAQSREQGSNAETDPALDEDDQTLDDRLNAMTIEDLKTAAKDGEAVAAALTAAVRRLGTTEKIAANEADLVKKRAALTAVRKALKSKSLVERQAAAKEYNAVKKSFDDSLAESSRLRDARQKLSYAQSVQRKIDALLEEREGGEPRFETQMEARGEMLGRTLPGATKKARTVYSNVAGTSRRAAGGTKSEIEEMAEGGLAEEAETPRLYDEQTLEPIQPVGRVAAQGEREQNVATGKVPIQQIEEGVSGKRRKREKIARPKPKEDTAQTQTEAPTTTATTPAAPGNLTVEESTASGYRERTVENAKADATIAFAMDFGTAGERLTANAAGKKLVRVPLGTMGVNEAAATVVRHLKALGAKSVNIAGNGMHTLGMSKDKITQERVDKFVLAVLTKVHEQHPIESIRSGGQTGADEAGAKAGVALGIPTTVLMPKGFKTRDLYGQDRTMSAAEARERFGGKAEAQHTDPLTNEPVPQSREQAVQARHDRITQVWPQATWAQRQALMQARLELDRAHQTGDFTKVDKALAQIAGTLYPEQQATSIRAIEEKISAIDKTLAADTKKQELSKGSKEALQESRDKLRAQLREARGLAPKDTSPTPRSEMGTGAPARVPLRFKKAHKTEDGLSVPDEHVATMPDGTEYYIQKTNDPDWTDAGATHRIVDAAGETQIFGGGVLDSHGDSNGLYRSLEEAHAALEKSVAPRRSEMSTRIAQDLGKTGIPVTHDSPHRFEGKLDWRKHKGRGEGNAAVGVGSYFSSDDSPHHYYKNLFTNKNSEEALVNKWARKILTSDRISTERSRAITLKTLSDGVEIRNKKLASKDLSQEERAKIERELTAIDTIRETVESAPLNTPLFENKASPSYHGVIRAKPEHFLDWEKPFSEQSEHVQKALKEKMDLSWKSDITWKKTGKDTYIGEREDGTEFKIEWDGGQFELTNTENNVTLEYFDSVKEAKDYMGGTNPTGAVIYRSLAELAEKQWAEAPEEARQQWAEAEKNEPTGQEKPDPERMATEALQWAGIVGHRYAVGAATGNVNPNASPNYVLYDDSLFDPTFTELSTMKADPSRTITEAEKKEILEYVKRVLGPKIGVEFKRLFDPQGKFDYSGEWDEAMNMIRISVHALAPGSIAHHEAIHALMTALRSSGDKNVQRVLQNMADSAPVRRQLERLLASEPKALKQLNDPEERLAYAYQFWAAGKLTVGPESKSLLRKVADFLRKITGLLSNDQQAEAILQAFHSGKLAQPGAAGAVLNTLQARHRQVAAVRKMLQPAIDKANELFATSEGLLMDYDNAALKEISALFNNATATTDRRQGFMQAKAQKMGQLMNKLERAVYGLEKKDLALALEALQTQTVAADPVARGIQEKVRAILDEMHPYLKDAKVERYDPATQTYQPLGRLKDYFPRAWSTDMLVTHGDEFTADLLKHHMKDLQSIADAANKKLRASSAATGTPVATAQLATPAKIADTILHSLIERKGQDDIKASTSSPGYTPYMQAVNERALKFIDSQVFAKYQGKDLVQIMSSYIAQGVKRAEYSRRFGADGEKLQALLLRATALEAQKIGGPNAAKEALERMQPAKRAVMAMEGVLGHDISPKWRRISSALMVYQNMRVLPLALFSSLIDPLGIIVNGGTMDDAYKAFKRGLSEVYKGWMGEKSHDDATRLAEEIGTVDSSTYLDALGETYSSVYMHGIPKKINDSIFRWNGMEAWNRAMRVQATQAAIGFIKRHKEDPNDHSLRYLKELGLDRADVQIANGKLKLTEGDGLTPAQAAQMQAAVMRWVDGSILRPNAAQRPTWASDPHYGLFFHLKQFTYSFHKVILARAAHEAQHGNFDPLMTMGFMYVPMMMAADVIKGVMQTAGGEPSWKRGWTFGDYLANGVQRAGLLGIPQLGVDAFTFGPDSLAGPSVEQVTSAFSDPVGTTVAKALPVNPVFKHMMGLKAA